MTQYLDAKRVQGVSLAGHDDPVVIGGTSSGTGSSTWADGTQDGSDHTVWYDIRRGTTVGEENHQSGTGVTGLANATTNGGDGFVDHPDTTNPSQGSDSQWGIRFKLTIDSITTNSSSTVKVGIGMSSSNGDGGGGHEGSLVMKFNNSTRKFMCTGSKSGGDTNDSSFTKEVGTNMMATGTWYCTVKQIGVTSYTKIRATVTQNSDYETSATSSDYTQDNDNWGNEDSNFVKYFRVFNSSGSSVDNHVYFKVEDMKLWNGTNDFSTTPTTTIDMAHSTGVGSSSTGAKSRYTLYSERNPLVIREEANWGNNGTKMNHTPPAIVEKAALVNDLSEGTIFEETDTKKVYFLQNNAWEQAYPRTATWENDLSSSSGWSNDNTSDLEVTGGRILYKDDNYNKETTYWDMTQLDDITGGISNTAWVLRFKITLSGSANGSDEPLFGFHMTENGSQAVDDNGDALGAYFYIDRSNTWRRVYGTAKADSTSIAGSTFSPHGWGNWTAGTSFWVEYSRNGSVFWVKAFLTSDFDTQQTSNATGNPTMSVAIPSGVGTLRYLTAGHYNQGAGYTVQIDDLQFWNGVSEL